MKARSAKFAIGQVVKHRLFPFRGLVFDVDPEFDNTEEWWLSIPEEIRPSKDQPFYHLFAENAETEYIAYVSEQNLLPDHSGEPLRNPMISEMFDRDGSGGYRAKPGFRRVPHCSRVACGVPRCAFRVLPEASSAALRGPSGRSRGRRKPCRIPPPGPRKSLRGHPGSGR